VSLRRRGWVRWMPSGRAAVGCVALHWVVAHPNDVHTLVSHESPLVALLASDRAPCLCSGLEPCREESTSSIGDGGGGPSPSWSS
jgi:hypothetical protein